MRTRKLLASAAVATIIAATASFCPADSLAQANAVLSPVTGWAVTNVSGDSSGNGAYCAMARRFSDNLIMTIAKNGQSEMSFALDFPKGDFDSQKSISIVLDPGAGQQRSYDVRPASKKAFVVRLGHDQPFMDALQMTGYLRADVNGESFSFGLSDIDKGNAKLDACLSGVTAPAAAREASSAITPFPGEKAGGGGPIDLGGSRHELEALRKENMALNAQMQSLNGGGASSEAQQQLEMLRKENEKLAAIVAASGASDGSAAGILQGLAAENQRLQSALSAKSSGADSGNEDFSGKEQAIADLTERLRILEQENLDLTRQIEKRADEADAAPADEDAIKKLMEENMELKDKLSAAEIDAALAGKDTGKLAILEQTIQRLKSKNDTLSEQVSTLTVAMDGGGGAGGDVSLLQSKNEILARQVKSLTKALGSGGRDAAQVDDLRRQVAELEVQNRMLQGSLSDVQTSAGGDAELEVLKASNERLEASLEIERDLKLTHKAEVGRLDEQLQVIGSENDALKEEISKVRAETQTLALSLEDAKKDKIMLQQKADAAALGAYELSELKTKHEVLKKESASLAAELDIIRSKNEESEKAQQIEIGALKRSNTEMQAALDAAKTEAELKAVSYEVAGTEIESLKVENEALKAEVLKMTLAAEDGQSLQSQIRSLMTENERLGREVTTREAELQKEILSLNEIVQNLQQQNDSLGQSVPVAGLAENVGNSAEIERLAAENTRLQAELAINEKYNEVAKSAREDVARLERQIDELHASNDKLTASLSALSAEADSYQELIQKQQDEIALLKKENGDLQQQVETLKAEAKTAVDLVSTEHKKTLEENRQLKDKLKDFIHKAALEKDEALRKLISENSRLRDQLHKADNAGRIIPVTYRPPVAPRKPDISLLRSTGGKASLDAAERRVAEELQKVTPAAGKSESAAPVQGPTQQNNMNEAQRAEEVMKKALEEAPQPAPVAAPEPVAEPVAVQQPEPLQPAAATTETPAVATPASKPDRAMPGVQDILKGAGVETNTQVQLVDAASKDGVMVYQWNAGNLYGSAEQRQTSGKGDFDSFAQDYIAKTKARCPGDFAAMTDGAARQGGIRIDSYEIACVGGQVSSTATLLFFERDGVFTVMAHETDAGNMDEAMEVRDRIIRAIAGTAI